MTITFVTQLTPPPAGRVSCVTKGIERGREQERGKEREEIYERTAHLNGARGEMKYQTSLFVLYKSFIYSERY